MPSHSCRPSPGAESLTSLTTDPIDPTALGALVIRPDHGAVTSFTGHVRNHHGGRSVDRLSYTAYPEMAEQECAAIAEEAMTRWDVVVAIRHRLGDLVIGDIAVAVAVGSAHRAEGFATCRFVIEEVKRRVPIWKHEHYADGTSAWVDPTAGTERRESEET
ncbi:MAG: molybdenum cofactor biosynthesis protein MoaE [Gemmatimonadales bacterium]|nr:molybdenum cofactor biosynthesis protein MoaE [Gemmatimonadales bacterium]